MLLFNIITPIICSTCSSFDHTDRFFFDSCPAFTVNKNSKVLVVRAYLPALTPCHHPFSYSLDHHLHLFASYSVYSSSHHHLFPVNGFILILSSVHTLSAIVCQSACSVHDVYLHLPFVLIVFRFLFRNHHPLHLHLFFSCHCDSTQAIHCFFLLQTTATTSFTFASLRRFESLSSLGSQSIALSLAILFV